MAGPMAVGAGRGLIPKHCCPFFTLLPLEALASFQVVTEPGTRDIRTCSEP